MSIPQDFFDRPENEQMKMLEQAFLTDESLLFLHVNARQRKISESFHGMLARLANKRLGTTREEDLKAKETLLYEIRDNFPPDSPHFPGILEAWRKETDRVCKDRFLRVFRKIGGPICQALLDEANGVTPDDRMTAKWRAGTEMTFVTDYAAPLVTSMTVRLDEEGRALHEWATTNHPFLERAPGGRIVQPEPVNCDDRPYAPGFYFARLLFFFNKRSLIREAAELIARGNSRYVSFEKCKDGDNRIDIIFLYTLPLHSSVPVAIHQRKGPLDKIRPSD